MSADGLDALRAEVRELRGVVALLAEALSAMPAHTDGRSLGAGLRAGVEAQLLRAGDHGLTRPALVTLLSARKRSLAPILAPLGAALAVLDGDATFGPGGVITARPGLVERVERVERNRADERARRRPWILARDRREVEAQREQP